MTFSAKTASGARLCGAAARAASAKVRIGAPRPPGVTALGCVKVVQMVQHPVAVAGSSAARAGARAPQALAAATSARVRLWQPPASLEPVARAYATLRR